MPDAQARSHKFTASSRHTFEHCSRVHWRRCGRVRRSSEGRCCSTRRQKPNVVAPARKEVGNDALAWPLAVQSGVRIAVAVPFRNQLPLQDRDVQLNEFLPYMERFLASIPGAEAAIIIVEQSQDANQFNRGQLLNIGFRQAQELLPDMTSFITHDVDLLPSMEMRPVYANPPSRGAAVHLASVWPKYSYDSFLGGVLSFCPDDFISVNGYPNDYWGWGLEDDQLALRMAHHKLRTLRVRVGSYVDLDPLNLKAVLESRQKDEIRKHLPWYNKEMFRRAGLSLDKDWSNNGLSNLDAWKLLDRRSKGIVHRVSVQLQKTGNCSNGHSCTLSETA